MWLTNYKTFKLVSQQKVYKKTWKKNQHFNLLTKFIVGSLITMHYRILISFQWGLRLLFCAHHEVSISTSEQLDLTKRNRSDKFYSNTFLVINPSKVILTKNKYY